MASLADVYEGQVGEHVDRRRLYFGVGLFSLGAVMALVGIVVGASKPTTAWLGRTEAVRLGGILAGLGVPAVFMGIFTVLPSGRQTKAAAVVGSGIAVLGVALFAYAYPCRWARAVCPVTPPELTLQVISVYALGVLTTFWCLFVAVVNFKSRNDPGGTVELEITRGGETRVIEVPESELDDGGAGGIGFFGDTPDGEVETQTNRPNTRSGTNGAVDGANGTSGEANGTVGGATGDTGRRRSTDRRSSNDSAFGPDGTPTTDGTGTSPVGGGSETSDGGPRPASPGHSEESDATARDVDDVGRRDTRGVTNETTAGTARGRRSGGSTTDDNAIHEVEPSEVATSPGDSYCGSCAHFQYVRTEEGMQPYCGFHDELMDDMDACPEWTQR